MFTVKHRPRRSTLARDPGRMRYGFRTAILRAHSARRADLRFVAAYELSKARFVKRIRRATSRQLTRTRARYVPDALWRALLRARDTAAGLPPGGAW